MLIFEQVFLFFYFHELRYLHSCLYHRILNRVFKEMTPSNSADPRTNNKE